MVEILKRILHIGERVASMENLSSAVTLLFVVMLVFGLLNCILGYRVLRFWMMLFGFGIGAAAGLSIAYVSGVETRPALLGAMGAGGVIVAAVAFLIYRAGIFLLGMGIGLALSVYVLHPTSSAVFFLCILIGVGLGVLAMRNARVVIIVGTSVLGGVLSGISLAKLGGLPEIPYGIGMSAGFAALGMLIQFAVNRPDDAEEEDEEPEETEAPEEREEE